VIQKADYIRAYADRYRDMFAVRLTTIVAVILVAAWVLDWGWAANFGLIQPAPGPRRRAPGGGSVFGPNGSPWAWPRTTPSTSWPPGGFGPIRSTICGCCWRAI